MQENEIRAEMVRLLRYANRQKVGAALGVSRASVSDWAAGRHVTPARLEQVRALFDAPDTTKEPPPEWATAMEQRLTGELGTNRQLIEALARPEIWRTAERVIARLEALGSPSDAAPHDSDGEEDRDAAELPGRGPG